MKRNNGITNALTAITLVVAALVMTGCDILFNTGDDTTASPESIAAVTSVVSTLTSHPEQIITFATGDSPSAVTSNFDLPAFTSDGVEIQWSVPAETTWITLQAVEGSASVANAITPSWGFASFWRAVVTSPPVATVVNLFASVSKESHTEEVQVPVTIVPATVINIAAISGVTAPATGATPVTTITETAQYTGTVTWSGSPATFAGSTVYTATITLTAKSGFTMTGVTANSFTVAGATATNPVDSGVITAVFPTTLFALTMVSVPAGTFQRDADATNTNTSTVSAFTMSQHEITRVQFEAIMGTDPSATTYSSGTGDPVQMVNWYHAIAFCNKLSLAEGLTPVYAVSGITDWASLSYASIPTTTTNTDWDAATATWTNSGYRLPTEMEWMWAAMGAPADGQGGGTNTTGYTKAFAGDTGSNAIGDFAWYSVNVTDSKSRPVGGKLANELGLYDMTGNVWEWTWDWYAAYPTGTQTDYRGAASGTRGRVRRGGSWYHDAAGCTVAIRPDSDPNFQNNGIGFRVVRP